LRQNSCAVEQGFFCAEQGTCREFFARSREFRNGAKDADDFGLETAIGLLEKALGRAPGPNFQAGLVSLDTAGHCPVILLSPRMRVF
jgi:hypothetical protein